MIFKIVACCGTIGKLWTALWRDYSSSLGASTLLAAYGPILRRL